MPSLLSIFVLGFFLGMRHATDPDHVIAVTTIVARHRTLKHGSVIGAWWGVGHTVTILVVGGGIILFGWAIPTRVGLSMEFSVGVMLIVLGFLNLNGILETITTAVSPSDQRIRTLIHSHPHGPVDHPKNHTRTRPRECCFDQHGPDEHPHLETTASWRWTDRVFAHIGLYQILRPLVVGIVHGLAGSAGVALLVLATIRNPKWALGYLLLFGLGTIVGMILITIGLMLSFARTERKFVQLNGAIRFASGLISLSFGLFLIYHIGFVNGLFTRHPLWSPR